MLVTMRGIAGSVFAKILLGLLVLSFGVWGIGDIFRYNNSDALVTVDGSTITTREFKRTLDREISGLRRSLGTQYSTDLIKNLGIPEQVLQEMINRILVHNEAARMNIQLSDAAIFNILRNNPSFQTETGGFDKFLFRRIIEQMGVSESDFIQEVKKDEEDKILRDALLSPPALPQSHVKTVHAAHMQERTADLLLFSEGVSDGKAVPEEEELKEFHQTNAQQFTLPEFRRLSYVIISAEALAKTITVSQEEVEAAYKQSIIRSASPEKRMVEQLLFTSEDKAKSALVQLRAGKAMELVAKNEGVLNANALSLGKIKENDVPEGAGGIVFSQKVGVFSEPYKSSFGWHIFHVSAIEPGHVTPFSQAAPPLRKSLAAQKAHDALYRLTHTIEDALASGATLEETAHSAGFDVLKLSPIDKNGNSQNGGKLPTPLLDGFLSTSFNLADNESSTLTSAGTDRYYIVRVDEIIPAKLRPFADVKSAVTTAWKKELAQKVLNKNVKEAHEALAAGSSTKEVAQKFGARIINSGKLARSSEKTSTGVALTRPLVDGIFSHGTGKATGFYKLPGGDYAIAVIREIGKQPSGEANAKEMAAISQKLQKHYADELLLQYIYHLRAEHSVHVNQELFETLLN